MDYTLIAIIILLLALLAINLRSFFRWKRRFEVKGVQEINTLEDLEMRLSSVLHGIREACFFVRTSDFSILEFNKRAYQLTGYTREDLSNMTLDILLSETSNIDLSTALHKLLEGDTSSSLFFELIRSDDVAIPIEVSVKRVRWGSESALLVVMLDTLEKMRLRERVAEDQEIILSIAEIISIFNKSLDEKQQFLDLAGTMKRLIPHQRMAILHAGEAGEELVGHYCDERDGVKINRERVELVDGTIYSKVTQTKQSMLISEMSRDAEGIEAKMAGEGFCSALIVPLLITEKVIGTISLFDTRPEAFTARDLGTVNTLAGHIALGAHTWNLSREMERKAQRLKQILVTSNSFRLQVFLDDLLREIVWSVRFSTGFGSVALGMVEKDSERVSIKALASDSKEVIRNLIGTSLSWDSFSRLMDEKNRVGRSYLLYTGEPILKKSKFMGNVLDLETIESNIGGSSIASLFVPIESRLGRVVGFLLVEDPQDGVRPSLETIQTLEIFANQVAVVIENQRLFADAKQKSEELETLNEKLRMSKDDIEAVARKLEESNRELEIVNAELREVDRFKAEFLQNITHELKTPIAPIMINSDMLLSRRLGDLAPQQEEVLQSINQSAKKLNELIMDLLYLSRMEDGKHEFVIESLDARHLISSCLREIYPIAKEKGISIKESVNDDTFLLLGDERHLIQLLTNLMRNAVKFTAKGGVVIISARNTEPDGKTVELEVSDTGVGIPESKLEKIFDRFYQVDGSPTRKFKGAGLGLAIVKKIVEAHNGDIEIKSQVGEGSSFKVKLPAHQNGS
jgi:PAS domain S-box-containing protein